MNWIDLGLIVLVLLSTLHGYRMGAVVQVLAYGGLLLGFGLGALVAPSVSSLAHSLQAKQILSLVVVFGFAILFSVAGRIVGIRVHPVLHRTPLALVDSGLGVGIAVAATLFVAWLSAGILVNGTWPALSSQITHSRILRAVDDILPPSPSWISRIQSALNPTGFPSVFAGIAPLAAGPVALPPNATVGAAVAADGASTVRIVGVGCNQIQEGSGFVAAPGYVVTNAHVVAGIPPGSLSVDDRFGKHPATAVLFDPRFDLAVLRVPGLHDPVLHLLDSYVARGQQGAVLGYPGGGAFTAVPAGVRAGFDAQGRDIYGEGLTVRPVYELETVVQPGDSGGPLAEPDGTVFGVVFSRSTTNPQVGYALATPGVVTRVASAESSGPVTTGACLSG